MILPTGKRTTNQRAGGFTLIELVLVMAILIVVLSTTGASLTSFFKGRSLEAEGKRFLALTRYAQNRAVSDGVTISLWIDMAERRYGLEVANGWEDTETIPTEFELARDLEIEVSWPEGAAIKDLGDEQALQFVPDAFIGDANPELIVIRQKDGEAVNIVPSANRLRYEITTNSIYAIRR